MVFCFRADAVRVISLRKAKPASEAFAPETYAALRQFITEHPISR